MVLLNALGETKTATDRNGNVHTFSYDVLGRQTADAVTTLGTGVDGAVRRIETAYNSAGLSYLFTSYDAASAGNIVNQVQDVYIVEHRNCGAYRKFLGKDYGDSPEEQDREEHDHRDRASRLRGEILDWCAARRDDAGRSPSVVSHPAHRKRLR